MERTAFIKITKEEFKEIYEKEHGFNDEINRNHPAYKQNENFFGFVLVGAKKLTKDEYEAVVNAGSNW